MAAPSQTSLIPPEEVQATAEMARLHLTPDELTRMASELSRILEFAASLRAVEVSGVEPTTHAVPLACPLRDDVVGSHDPVETALRNAPATEATFFTVPAILTHDDPSKPSAV
jgi:aspartyl-tRNA(Asn)/glutamyl-tRNA(Gln) amidotransferase subunit C